MSAVLIAVFLVAGVLALGGTLLLVPATTLARFLRFGLVAAALGGIAATAALGGPALTIALVVCLVAGIAIRLIVRPKAPAIGAGVAGEGMPEAVAPVTSIRTAGLEMVLDRRRVRLDGTVLAGRFIDRRLSELDGGELMALRRDLRSDRDSLRLLEAYLDRLHPAWRENVKGNDRARLRAAAEAGGMSAEEAYRLLGLAPGAGETEIREAHRRLAAEAERQGEPARAERVNEARNRLLDKHRGPPSTRN